MSWRWILAVWNIRTRRAISQSMGPSAESAENIAVPKPAPNGSYVRVMGFGARLPKADGANRGAWIVEDRKDIGAHKGPTKLVRDQRRLRKIMPMKKATATPTSAAPPTAHAIEKHVDAMGDGRHTR